AEWLTLLVVDKEQSISALCVGIGAQRRPQRLEVDAVAGIASQESHAERAACGNCAFLSVWIRHPTVALPGNRIDAHGLAAIAAALRRSMLAPGIPLNKAMKIGGAVADVDGIERIGFLILDPAAQQVGRHNAFRQWRSVAARLD